MSDTLNSLVDYWTTRYAVEVDTHRFHDHDMPPLVVVVGAVADVIVSNEEAMADPIGTTAHLVGMMVYPCDGVHVVACIPTVSIEMPELKMPEDPLNHPDARLAVLCWAHTIPTSESAVALMVRQEDGQWMWLDDAGGAEDAIFDAFRTAAHDFDRFPITDHEREARQSAIDVMIEANGSGYVAQFLHPGAIMAVVHEFESHAN